MKATATCELDICMQNLKSHTCNLFQQRCFNVCLIQPCRGSKFISNQKFPNKYAYILTFGSSDRMKVFSEELHGALERFGAWKYAKTSAKEMAQHRSLTSNYHPDLQKEQRVSLRKESDLERFSSPSMQAQRY
jgi:hypothetical protein